KEQKEQAPKISDKEPYLNYFKEIEDFLNQTFSDPALKEEKKAELASKIVEDFDDINWIARRQSKQQSLKQVFSILRFLLEEVASRIAPKQKKEALKNSLKSIIIENFGNIAWKPTEGEDLPELSIDVLWFLLDEIVPSVGSGYQKKLKEA